MIDGHDAGFPVRCYYRGEIREGDSILNYRYLVRGREAQEPQSSDCIEGGKL